ncbi:anti-sigma factor domain-containing protein [Massilia sp. CF038]|uniref:anti-sigma factor n=1 Tax=Massilia sp. CF038 TaxID=1881045 RepID=UPI000912A4F1|nr:anti-sigma factor [Massilia sp. CF038]SHH46342.1 Anti-sigma-K factor RskA [Massilia sp. CF038]
MNIRNNVALREKLAAEYVLGTLRGGARRRFEGWMFQDADLRNITAQWQQRLSPMAEFAGSVQPPKSVWTGIERRLNLKARATGWEYWIKENIAFWRGLGIASSGLAALLLVVVMNKAPDDNSKIAYVATLNDDKAQAAMLVTADTRNHTLDMRLITNAQIAADKSLELWAVPKSGNPRSLGVLAGNRGKFKLPDTALSGDVMLLAVTLEPKGGSPNPNGPTGPIIYKGNWVRL